MYITKLIHNALSDADIHRILGEDAKTIQYSELSQFNDLDELLPDEKDYCIVLYEDSPGKGHWAGLCKCNGVFEHFDSYGMRPDSELKWLNMRQRQSLGETTPYLNNLLKREHYIYNDIHSLPRPGHLREYLRIAHHSQALQTEER